LLLCYRVLLKCEHYSGGSCISQMPICMQTNLV